MDKLLKVATICINSCKLPQVALDNTLPSCSDSRGDGGMGEVGGGTWGGRRLTAGTTEMSVYHENSAEILCKKNCTGPV